MRGPADSVALLRNHALFGTLPRAILERFSAHFTKRKAKRGTTIFRKGDAGTELIAVLSGSVRISAPAADGREAVLNHIREGEIFGEIALLDGQPRSADAVAASDCEIMVVDRREFIELVRKQPEFAFKLIETLCARLRRTSEQVEDLMFLDLPMRLAKALLRLADEVEGKLAAQDCRHPARAQPVDRHVTRKHEQTAEALGTSRIDQDRAGPHRDPQPRRPRQHRRAHLSCQGSRPSSAITCAARRRWRWSTRCCARSSATTSACSFRRRPNLASRWSFRVSVRPRLRHLPLDVDGIRRRRCASRFERCSKAATDAVERSGASRCGR